MSDARSSGLLQRVRTLFGSGVVAGLSDAELLERFRPKRATAEDAALAAEAAFAALVARHGPMVLGVCRRAWPTRTTSTTPSRPRSWCWCAGRDRSGWATRWAVGCTASRGVAAKARARSERDRVRTAPLEHDPVAPDDPADRIGLLAALDEEVSRLPEKYRAPVVLCHLEGLTHAEAADRLRWPVGTVSGRLSRARDLLRDRLVRRGIAPIPAVAVLTSEGVRAAVPEPLATATVRAATRLAMGGGSQAGAVSASALSLMNAVLRAAAMVRLKVAAAVLLAIAVAGTAVAAGGGWSRRPRPARSGRRPGAHGRVAAGLESNRRSPAGR